MYLGVMYPGENYACGVLRPYPLRQVEKYT